MERASLTEQNGSSLRVTTRLERRSTANANARRSYVRVSYTTSTTTVLYMGELPLFQLTWNIQVLGRVLEQQQD